MLRYDAFISYSHALDGVLSQALQTGVERFAKPWYRLRALRVFRDTTSLSANPGLWSSIETALASSTWLVLMASPNAAQSPWVDREVAWWLANKSPQRLLVVLTEGEFAWADDLGEGDELSSALPPALRGALREEPRWVDLRWMRDVDQVDQSNPRLRECVADIAAAVREVAKDELVGEHIRQHRRTMRLARGGATALAVLVVAALTAAVVAVGQRNQAVAAQRTAIVRSMVAQADGIRDRNPRGALQFGLAAHQLDPSPLTQASLTQTLTSSRYRSTLAGQTGSVLSVAFSPDGHTLATASADRTVILWDLTDRPQPHRLGQPLTGHTDSVLSVAFSPDGHTLATASADRTVILWDLTDRPQPRQLGQPLTGHTDSVLSVAFSPDGHTLATGSLDETVILWDLTERTQPHQLSQLHPLTGGISWVYSVAFSPDGRTLATGTGDQAVVLWDLTDRARPRRLGQPLTDHTDSVFSESSSGFSVVFSPDGHTLVTASGDGPVVLWDLTERTQPRRLGQPLTGHTSWVSSVAFSPDGHTLATASNDRTVILWDLTDRARPHSLGQPLTGHTDSVSSVAFSPDGHTLATASADQTVILWDLADRARLRQLGQPLTDHGGSVFSVAFSPDGHTLATASADQTVILWDLADRARPRRLGQPLTGYTGMVFSVAFSPDGHTLAASDNQTVILWDLSDRTQPRRLGEPLTDRTSQASPPEVPSRVAFSPDGHILATSVNRTVVLWDLSDRTQPRQLGKPLTNHASPVRSVAFSPDGHTLATASDNRTVVLWDLSDRTQLHQLGQPLTGHTNSVSSEVSSLFSVVFSPDGHTLATASADSTVVLWDLTHRTQPRQLGQPLTVYGSGGSVVFSPDGHTLAIPDWTVILWDLTDRTQPRQLGQSLTSHINYVESVAFSPDGHTLATASGNGTVILWDLTPLEELRRDAVREACTRAGGSLDEATWNIYAPGISYQDPCPSR